MLCSFVFNAFSIWLFTNLNSYYYDYARIFFQYNSYHYTLSKFQYLDLITVTKYFKVYMIYIGITVAVIITSINSKYIIRTLSIFINFH